MPISQLPYLDEHVTVIAADADDVWPVLLAFIDGALSAAPWARYARLVGCADRTASGPRPLAAGSTVPGFRVVSLVPGSELALEGNHRFSSYALIFRIEEVGEQRSRLSAETRATFPGIAGSAYRLLVLGTGGHVVGVRHMLSVIRRRSEARVRSQA